MFGGAFALLQKIMLSLLTCCMCGLPLNTTTSTAELLTPSSTAPNFTLVTVTIFVGSGNQTLLLLLLKAAMMVLLR